MLHVRPYSPAARDVDELASRYAEALRSVSSALDVDADALPTIDIYLADLPSAEPSVSPTVQDEAILGDTTQSHEITIWTAYGNESPAIAAEAEVARALLAYGFGVGQPSARFWDEGLAGHIAAKSGRSSYHADAEAHSRQLLHDGALPPLSELVAESAGRVSAISSTAATAFASYLIDRYGLPRYHRLLHEARTGDQGAFDSVYPVPLAIADRDWRRHLEATAGDAQPGLWPTLRRLIPIAQPYWRSGLAVLACSLVGVGFSLAMPLSFRFLIDNILARRPLSQAVPFVGLEGPHDRERPGTGGRADPAADVPGLAVRAQRGGSTGHDAAAGVRRRVVRVRPAAAAGGDPGAAAGHLLRAPDAIRDHRAGGPRRRGGAGRHHAGGRADGLGGGRDRLLRGAALCAGAEARGDHADRAAGGGA